MGVITPAGFETYFAELAEAGDPGPEAETRAALEEIMRSHPHLSQYNEFYVRPEDVPNLTPEEILLMRKYTEMNDAARKVAFDRRKRGDQQ